MLTLWCCEPNILLAQLSGLVLRCANNLPIQKIYGIKEEIYVFVNKSNQFCVTIGTQNLDIGS